MSAEDAYLFHLAEHGLGLDRPGPLGVAVSGGSDSMASLHLLSQFWDVRAVTVDHRLRVGATQEAAAVAQTCAEWGVAHDILPWRHGAITGNLQDAARRARYRLIAAWAKKHQITHVVLGHTADDQAETILMRIARQAGVDGLSGMAARREHGGILFLRPFLGVEREELRAYLRRRDFGWIDDPSNTDPRFERVKARRALEALAPLGIGAHELSGVAHNMQMARNALAHYDAESFARIGTQDRGDLTFATPEFHRLHPETQRRLLVAALRWVSGSDYAPRSDAVIRLDIALRQGKSRTLQGCRVLAGKGEIRITREARAVQDEVAGTRQLWDRRWRMHGPHSRALSVRALGAEGLRYCPDARSTGLPRASLLASPAIWQDNILIAAPLAQMGEKWRVSLAPNRADFISFLLSH